MKRMIAVMAAFLLLVQPVQAAAFPDTENNVYRDAIEDLVRRGVVEGYPDGTFKPKNTVNRAELLTILLRGKGVIPKAERRCFADVSLRAWYADPVCEGKKKGIVKGEKGNLFYPERTVNFAEALKITIEALDIPVEPTSAEGAWYEPYVATAHTHGIISRYSFIPWQGVTRERMADILRRALDYKDHPSAGIVSKRLSPGCAQEAPGTPPSRITVGGIPRDFITYVPRDYSPSEPRRLLVAFHGRTNSNKELRGYLELEKEGGENIIVYPAALPNGGGTYNWADPGDPLDDLRDFAFFDEIVRTIGSQYCVDLNEIYVIGYSLGGWFGNAVACSRASVVRGVATLGGSSPGIECDAPVAAMIIHNPKDNLSTFTSGEQARDVFLQANMCEESTKPISGSSLNCIEYTCAGEPVRWCPHTVDHAWWDDSFYPHVWPKGTARQILQFFDNLRH